MSQEIVAYGQQSPLELCRADCQWLKDKLLEVQANLAAQIGNLEGELMTVTRQLNDWSEAVDSTLDETEGEKQSFAEWVTQLQSRVHNIEESISLNERQRREDASRNKIDVKTEVLASIRAEMYSNLKNDVVHALKTEMHSTLKDELKAIVRMELQTELRQGFATQARDMFCNEIKPLLVDEWKKDIKEVNDHSESRTVEQVVKIRSEVDRCKYRLGDLERRSSPGSSSAAAVTPAPIVAPPPPPPIASYVAPTPYHSRAVSSIKVSDLPLTKTLSTLKYQQVKEFVDRFKAITDGAGLSERELKSALIKGLEGDAFRMVARYVKSETADQLMKRLIQRVKPSENALAAKLRETRQHGKECVQDFAVRFQMVADELPQYPDSRIRDTFIENLNFMWQRTASGVVASNDHITLDQLIQYLMKVEGPNAANTVDIGEVSLDEILTSKLEAISQPSIGQPVLPNGEIKFDAIRGERDFFNVFKTLMRQDRNKRQEYLNWLHSKPAPRMNRNYNNNYRPWRPQHQRVPQHQRGRVNNYEEVPAEIEQCEEEHLFDDCLVEEAGPSSRQLSSVQVIHKKKKKKNYQSSETLKSSEVTKARSYASVARVGHENKMLMYVNASLNGIGRSCLIDTGAAISVISEATAKKIGLDYDPEKAQELSAFNGDKSYSLGTCPIRVTLGHVSFRHDFCVIPSSETKVIFGNDLLKSLGIGVHPAKHCIELMGNHVIPCHVIDATKRESPNQNVDTRFNVRVTEKVQVNPIMSEDTLLIPAGKSFSLAAKSSKTVVLPYIASETVQVSDCGRMTPGVASISTVWAKGKKLRLTICNTSEKSVMVGSKTAIAGVILKSTSTPMMTDIVGNERELKRV